MQEGEAARQTVEDCGFPNGSLPDWRKALSKRRAGKQNVPQNLNMLRRLVLNRIRMYKRAGQSKRPLNGTLFRMRQN